MHPFSRKGLRKLTVGINGVEFTRDAQIKYLAQNYIPTLLHNSLFDKSVHLRVVPDLVLLWGTFRLCTGSYQGCFAPHVALSLTGLQSAAFSVVKQT